MKNFISSFAALCCCAMAVTAQAQESKSFYTPEIHGTVRAKYEYKPQIEKGRFEVRNARVSVEGKLIPIVSYKAEIDLSDEGAIKMLDAYVRLQPVKGLKFTVGQMRVPFSIDAHRSPHLQFFANRSFIAKQAGNVRDVGVSAGLTFGKEVLLLCKVACLTVPVSQIRKISGPANITFPSRRRPAYGVL